MLEHSLQLQDPGLTSLVFAAHPLTEEHPAHPLPVMPTALIVPPHPPFNLHPKILFLRVLIARPLAHFNLVRVDLNNQPPQHAQRHPLPRRYLQNSPKVVTENLPTRAPQSARHGYRRLDGP